MTPKAAKTIAHALLKLKLAQRMTQEAERAIRAAMQASKAAK